MAFFSNLSVILCSFLGFDIFDILAEWGSFSILDKWLFTISSWFFG